jgi:hypothetical protein
MISALAGLVAAFPAAAQGVTRANPAAVAARPAAQGAATARFNPQAPENRLILPSFSYATVEPVLNSIGARFERVTQAAARPVLRVILPNNRRATLLFGSCNAAGACKALVIQSTWAKPTGAADRTSQAVAAFNQRYSFTKATLLADGRPALQRYLTADYGFIRGDLAVNLLVFANQADRFTSEALLPLQAKK